MYPQADPANTAAEIQELLTKCTAALPIEQEIPTLVNDQTNTLSIGAMDCEWNRKEGITLVCFRDIGDWLEFGGGEDEGGRSIPIQYHLYRDFNGDKTKFLNAVLNTYRKYSVITGFNLLGKGSDIDRLYEDCRQVGLLTKCEQTVLAGRSVKNFNSGFGYTKQPQRIVDLYNIISNKSIKGGLAQAGVEYRNNSLDSFSQGYIKEGKLEGLTGLEVQQLGHDTKENIEKQIAYCQKDVDLVVKSIVKDNFNLFRIIKNTAIMLGDQDPGGKGFLKAANAQYVSVWWTTLIDNDELFEMPPPESETMIDNEKQKARIQQLKMLSAAMGNKSKKIESQYGGGTVFDPVPGIFRYALSVDVGAMYPSIIDVWNLDPLTIRCECCKDDPDARIPIIIMQDINFYLQEKDLEERNFHYWICRKKRGRLADIFHKLIQLKKYFKDHNMTIHEKATKLVMNSGYGVLASTSFPYFFYMIPELVTGIARFTISGLPKRVKAEEASEMLMVQNNNADSNNYTTTIIKSSNPNNLRPIYADTDSLFLEAGVLPQNSEKVDKIIAMAKSVYGVELSRDKTWKLLFLTELKKQYCGIIINKKTGKDELAKKTMTGLKNDRPPFSKQMFLKLISEEHLKPFEYTEEENPGILLEARNKIKSHIKDTFTELKSKVIDSKDQQFIEKQLYYSFSPDRSRPLDSYTKNVYQKECYREFDEMRITKGLTRDSEEFQDWIAGEQEFKYWKIKPVKVPNEDFNYEDPSANMKTQIVKDNKTKQPKLDEQGNPITKQVEAITEERDKIYTSLYIHSKIRGYEIDLAKYMAEMIRASAPLLKTLGIDVVSEIRDTWYECKLTKKRVKKKIVEVIDVELLI